MKFTTGTTINPLTPFECENVKATIASARLHGPKDSSEVTSIKIDFKVQEPAEFKGKLITKYFSVSDDNMWRFDEFLQALGFGKDYSVEFPEDKTECTALLGYSLNGKVVIVPGKEKPGINQGKFPDKSDFAQFFEKDAETAINDLL